MTVPVHTHRWGGVLYVIATSDFVRRSPNGTVIVDTRLSRTTPVAGAAVWGAPLTPHSLENVGSHEFRTLTVEMKDTDPDQRRDHPGAGALASEGGAGTAFFPFLRSAGVWGSQATVA